MTKIMVGDICKVRRGNPGEGTRCRLINIFRPAVGEAQVCVEWVIGGGTAILRASEICAL